MGLRSGLCTFRAHHFFSIANAAINVERIVGEIAVVLLAKRKTEVWLSKACQEQLDIGNLVNRLRSPSDENPFGVLLGKKYQYSLAQLCDLNE